jgi:hypothetical protein
MCWKNAGLCFEVKNRGLLGDALAEHFRHRKFSSFQRQLNYFGFKHAGRGIYKHPCFTRNDRDLALRITRKTRPKPVQLQETHKVEFDKVELDSPDFDDIVAKEEGCSLGFLSIDSNVPSALSCQQPLRNQLTSVQLYEQRERQIKLQLQLEIHLQKQNKNGPSNDNDQNILRENVPHAHVVSTCSKTLPGFPLQHTPFFSQPKSNSLLLGLQYQVSTRYFPVHFV